MVADFVAEVRALQSYRPENMSEEEIRSSAHLALTSICRSIIHFIETGSIDLGSLPERIASSRVRLRVLSEDFVDAMRLDFTVLWRHVLSHARPEEQSSLAGQVEPVWNVIDQYVRETRDRYQSLLFDITPEARSSRQHCIARIFSELSGSKHEEAVAKAAEVLQLSRYQPFTVCVISAEAFDSLRIIERNLEGLNARFFVWDRGNEVVFFWPANNRLREASERERVLAPISEIPYGCVDDVEDMSRLPKAANLARHLLQNAPLGHVGPCGLREAWPQIAANAILRLQGDFSSLFAQMNSVKPAERSRILETAGVFFECGSVSETAQILFTHRNTVMNRLNRFHEITGLDPSKPRDAAFAIIQLSGIENFARGGLSALLEA